MENRMNAKQKNHIAKESSANPEGAELRTGQNTERKSAIGTPFLCSRLAIWLALGLIALATIAAYSTTLQVPFIFDDEKAIQDNPTIRSLWPIGKMLIPPGNGAAVQRRPVANVTLAINYAISGLNVWSYHAFNITAHLLAAFLLFGVVRRSLLLPQYEAEWSMAATPLAFAIAFLWAVHPLLTEAVTYIVQRTEVLAGLFYLLTLYCVIRGATTIRSLPWYAMAVVACALAMGSKEAALSAPVVVLLYDRIFLSPSWRETFRRRKVLYLGLAATWSVILIMLPYGQEGTAVFGSAVERVTQYALAQCGVITHYLRLCFWPHPLIVDYGIYTPLSMLEIVPYLLLMLALLAATAWAFRRQPWLGFLGVWFFAILAPSSSIIPLPQQIAAEKRMYLPLAAVITGVVIGVFFLGRRFVQRGKMTQTTAQKTGLGLVLLTGCILAWLAYERNNTYGDALTLWKEVIYWNPNNGRAYSNLADVHSKLNQMDEAMSCSKKAVELQPNLYRVHKGMGIYYARHGRFQEALECFEKAIHFQPSYEEVTKNPEMISRLPSDYAEPFFYSAVALTNLGRFDEAILMYKKGLRITPNNPVAYCNLGAILASHDRENEAIPYFEKALDLQPANANIHCNLGKALTSCGRYLEAATHYREALKIDPKYGLAYNSLAMLLSSCQDDSIRNGQQAVVLAQQAIQLANSLEPVPFETLASAYAETGQFPEAVQALQKAIDLATQQNKPPLVEMFNKKLQLFQAGKPFRLPPPRVTNPQSPH
jgi:tetratricopeptide (TPR) repeat protein